MNKVVEIITDKIIKSLESGNIPAWRKTWVNGMPKNYVSNKEYTGFNAIILSCGSYSNPYWLTYKQAQEQGGNVKTGEKSTPIIFWKMLEDKESEKAKSFPLLRYYNVFNFEQCENLPDKNVAINKTKNEKIKECEEIVNNYKDKPEVLNGTQALYRPLTDKIEISPIEYFDNSENYYGTLFHELVHSTGHKDRLNREGITELVSFGDGVYSFEELIAEFGSAFLCGKTGISQKTLENQTAYIKGWLNYLKSDKQALIKAGTQSQKAYNYILNIESNNLIKEIK